MSAKPSDRAGGSRREKDGDARGERNAGTAAAQPGRVDAELAAPRAVLEVPDDEAAAQGAAAQARQLGADLAARGLAGLPPLLQRHVRLVDERLDLAAVAVELVGDLVVRTGLERGEDEGLALDRRQAVDVAEELAKLLAALDGLRQRLRLDLERLTRQLAPAAPDQVDALVVGDRVEPRPQVRAAAPGAKRAVSAEEGLLDGVLRLLGVAEDVAAEGEQRWAEVLVNEGELVAAGTEVLASARSRRRLEVEIEGGYRSARRCVFHTSPFGWRVGRRCPYAPRNRKPFTRFRQL